MVICGDGSDEELLSEERIDQMDSVVALTGIDEENIILSLFAKTKVKLKTVTKINRIQLNDVIRSLDLDSVVYPKHLTSEMILQYVRATQNSIGSNVETLYKLVNDNVEALGVPYPGEFQSHQRKPSKTADSPGCAGGVHLQKRPGDYPKRTGSNTPGDSVIVVTTCSGLTDVADILES